MFWEILVKIGVPILQFIFELIAKKKLSDEEFAEYIKAHQLRRKRVGTAALDWKQAVDQVRKNGVK